jgi:hypothetical protein
MKTKKGMGFKAAQSLRLVLGKPQQQPRRRTQTFSRLRVLRSQKRNNVIGQI